MIYVVLVLLFLLEVIFGSGKELIDIFIIIISVYALSKIKWMNIQIFRCKALVYPIIFICFVKIFFKGDILYFVDKIAHDGNIIFSIGYAVNIIILILYSVLNMIFLINAIIGIRDLFGLGVNKSFKSVSDVTCGCIALSYSGLILTSTELIFKNSITGILLKTLVLNQIFSYMTVIMSLFGIIFISSMFVKRYKRTQVS